MSPIRRIIAASTLAIIATLLWTWSSPVQVQTTIANNAADMASHIVMVADSTTPRTVTNLFTFNRGGVVAPFAVGNAGAATVTNLDADLLDAQHGSFYQSSTNQNAGTLPFARFPAVTWTVTTVTTTGTQNDWAPTITGNTQLRCNNATLLTVQGIAAGSDGQLLELVSVGAGQVDLSPQNASSSAANRLLNFATVGSTSLAAGSGTVLYRYDGTTARWRMLNHDQGAWITPTFAAGNYTGNASMTWTLTAGDVTTQAYMLRGRTVTVQWYLATTTVGGTPNTTLQIGAAAWGSYTPTKAMGVPMQYTDNSATVWAHGHAFVAAAGTVIQLYRVTFGANNWTASADLTYQMGQLSFEVQ